MDAALIWPWAPILSFATVYHGTPVEIATTSIVYSHPYKSHTVDVPQKIKDSLRKFRFARRDAGSAALIVKINKQQYVCGAMCPRPKLILSLARLIMEEVDQFDSISIEDLAEGLSKMLPYGYFQANEQRPTIRAPRELTSIYRTLIRTEAFRWSEILPIGLDQLGADIE